MFNSLDPYDLIDVVRFWRFYVPLAMCIGLALGVYYLAGQTPDAAAMAVFIGLTGLVSGVIWQIGHAKSREP